MNRAPAASMLLLAVMAAACGTTATPSVTTGTSASAQATPAVTDAPVASTRAESQAPSASNATTDTPVPSSAESSAPPASAPAAPTDGASPAPSASGAALACQPEGNNPSFWPGIAAAVSWDVYCAVLPKGWSVSTGKYRLANGGYLVISYKGPSGATATLSEGSFCTDGSGCVPSGPDSGSATFGSMAATLVTTDAGGFAIVAARGQQPSWLLVTSGLDQATTVALGAALAPVH